MRGMIHEHRKGCATITRHYGSIRPPPTAVAALTRFRSALPLAITALLPFVASPCAEPAAPANAENKVELRIEFYAFAGLHVLTNRTTVDASSGRYRIRTAIDTRGIVSLFIDLTSYSETRGHLAGDSVLPEHYDSDVRRNGVDRRYRIDYAPRGPLASQWAPPETTWQSPVPPEKLAGTVDQLTAYFIAERQLRDRGSCNIIVPVFDGRGRYDLRFRDAKHNDPATRGARYYSGPVHVCDVSRDDVAGFAGNRDPAEATYQRGKLRYAQLGPAGRMVPVQIDYDTEFGVVTGYLAELRGPDGTRRFME
jgi:hypothetical protein